MRVLQPDDGNTCFIAFNPVGLDDHLQGARRLALIVVFHAQSVDGSEDLFSSAKSISSSTTTHLSTDTSADVNHGFSHLLD